MDLIGKELINIVEDNLVVMNLRLAQMLFLKYKIYHMFFDYWSSEEFRKTKYRTIGYAYLRFSYLG